MKKLLIAFSMVGAGALIACADTGAQSNSVTTNYAHDAWFSASATVTTLNEAGGNFSTIVGSASSFAAKEGKIEIDGDDVTDPVSFVLLNETTGKTTDLTRVTFELEASVVPTNALPSDLELTAARTAFALVASQDKTTTNFQAWVTGGWKALNGFTIPEVNDPYDLTMRFDDSDSNAKKVQFSVVVNNVTNESAWLSYGGLSSRPQVDFVGCGKLKSMNADQVWVVSSEIIIEGGSVTIAKEDEAAMGDLIGSGETIENVLESPVSNRVQGIVNTCKLSTAEAYAIGLIANESDTMVAKADGTFKVKADAQASVSGGIPVGFVTPLTPNDSTAAVTYTLMGSADGTTYSPIGGMTDKANINEIRIPTSEITGGNKYRYFKVVTTVMLKDAQ